MSANATVTSPAIVVGKQSGGVSSGQIITISRNHCPITIILTDIMLNKNTNAKVTCITLKCANFDLHS